MVVRIPLWLILVVGAFIGALGASAAAAADQAGGINFWDQHQRMARPTLGERQRVRFLTTTDFPPFNFLDSRGKLGGFNVDLARLLCEELGVLERCQIEAVPFAELASRLERGDAEAIIAGLSVTAANRSKFGFTGSYFRFPARFVMRRDRPLPDDALAEMRGRAVGVVEGSAHAAMLAAFFPAAKVVPFKDQGQALDALKSGTVETVFGDGVGLSFWLESDAAASCCAFAGGPYLSDRFLGEGLAIAVGRSDAELVRALDYALGQIVAKHRFSELMLRYFPVSPF
ncbi:transporter substrate-binding domain-containing protein [Mangrovicella endophytica]|uniref:transporter substrate-binding domain-containing protein n=1 Tax=Mangrovicella endophytica TaxID=2066697 RepID=UPI000C9EC5DB|nr:transporter substrate-binding domain-containing protein [Mangrovicella endophytica]